MYLRRFSHYLLEHSWQTVALTFIISSIPIFGVVGILIAALVTLCSGVSRGAILTFAATIPYVIVFYLMSNHETVTSVMAWVGAVGFAVVSNILTFVFAVMLYRKTKWSLILQIAALLGVLAISVIHLIYPQIANWWAEQLMNLQSYYDQAQTLAGNAKPSTAVIDARLETIAITKHFATGIMAAGILFNAILQLIVARWWQAALFDRGGLRKELHGIRLSQLAGVLFVISLVFSYLGNAVVLDIMPILYLLFGAAGLSLVHYFFGHMKSVTVWFWLAIFYASFIYSLPASLLIVSIVALCDIWLDLRKRFKNFKQNF